MMLLKKMYDKLVARVNSTDTSRFVLKTMYDTDKSELENEIPDTNGLVKKTDYNATEMLQKLKTNLIIIIMTNILQLQRLIL